MSHSSDLRKILGMAFAVLIVGAGFLEVRAQPTSRGTEGRDRGSGEGFGLLPNFSNGGRESTNGDIVLPVDLRPHTGALNAVKPLNIVSKEPASSDVRWEDAGKAYQALRLIPSIESLRFSLPETVCHPDERSPVTNSTQAPYHANCLLLLTLSGGGRARGTGWLINQTTVVTAGHCVHDGDGGAFFEEVEVIPGAYVSRVGDIDIIVRPYGSQTVPSERLRASDDWKNSGSIAKDYGAVLLERPFSSDLGSPQPLRIAVLSDGALEASEFTLAGYPGDKPTGTQWEHGGRLDHVQAERLHYLIDTVGGQSGSALYRLTREGPQVVGIHNYGGCPNKCTRITNAVADDLEQWQLESERSNLGRRRPDRN